VTKTISDIKVHESLGALGAAETTTDGQLRMRIRIIESDKLGSTGYYSAGVLREYGPAAFPKGTHMHLDHQSWMEFYESPAGSLKDFAAVIDSDPVYQEASGDQPAGLYADVLVFSQYATLLREMAPYIGVSIDAIGRGEEAVIDGMDTIIMTELFASELNRVDFVTHPGAGGRIVSLLESKKIAPPEGARYVNNTPAEKVREDKAKGGVMGELTEQTGRELLTSFKEVGDLLKAQESDRKAKEAAEAKAKEEAKQVDLVQVIESAVEKLTEAGLPKVIRTKVIESISTGVPLDDAIKEWSGVVKAVREEATEDAAPGSVRVTTRATESMSPSGKTQAELLGAWGVKS
jgi:hypothetical protein